MTFGDAIDYLKAGHKVAREGWNGKNMFIYLNKGSVDMSTESYQTERGNVVSIHSPFLATHVESIPVSLFEPGDVGTVTRLSNINMAAASGSTVTGWLASQSDMLAEDWAIIP